MGIVTVIRRLRDEFTALPGLRLTEAQVERLCAADGSSVAPALCALVSAGFLQAMPDGSFVRTDVAADLPLRDVRQASEPACQGAFEQELS
jgi:hypothetical protein